MVPCYQVPPPPGARSESEEHDSTASDESDEEEDGGEDKEVTGSKDDHLLDAMQGFVTAAKRDKDEAEGSWSGILATKFISKGKEHFANLYVTLRYIALKRYVSQHHHPTIYHLHPPYSPTT